MAVENAEQASIQQNQLQLTTSWNGKNVDLFEYEMYCASIRTGINLNEMFFTLPKVSDKFEASSLISDTFKTHSHEETTPFEIWSKFISNALRNHKYCKIVKSNGQLKIPTNDSGNPIISVADVVRAVLIHSAHYTDVPFLLSNTSVMIIITVNAFFPMVNLAFADQDASGIVCYITSCINNLFFYGINLMFFRVAVLDVLQRRMHAKILTRMIRSNNTLVHDPHSVIKSIEIPVINLRDSPLNIHSWLKTRLILQNFGKRLQHRTDVYVGSSLFVVLILAVLLVYHLFTSPDAEGDCLFFHFR